MSPGSGKVVQARRQALLVVVLVVLVMILAQGTALSAAKSGLVDINAATQAELEAVKGIGPVLAKKIIDNRPYRSLEELSKAGLSAKKINEFKSFLTVKAAPAAAPPPAAAQAGKAGEPTQAGKKKEAKAAPAAAGAPVDLNAADQKTLEGLPGIGPALAKKIIEARPFQSVDDLSRVKGLSKAKVEALKGQVTVAPAKAAAPAAQPAPGVPAAKAPPVAEKPEPAPEPGAKPKAAKEKQGTPRLEPGQRVNLNTASQEDIEKIPGIGPVKAQAIIKNRPYKTPEDIMKVRGIKDKTYQKIKDYITVQ